LAVVTLVIARFGSPLSTLLEPDSSTARLALQKRLKKIYEKRSRVVHGAVYLSPEEASEVRNGALKLAIEMLRKLYSSRTDLLGFKSEERSTQILLKDQSS
jgi:hypothetical protein